MSLRAELEVEFLRAVYDGLRSDIRTEYARVKANPKYWTGKRMAGMQSRLIARINEAENHARGFYENRIPEIYETGAREFKPNFRMTKNDWREIASIQDSGLLKIQVSSQLSQRNVKSWALLAKESPGKAAKIGIKGIVTKAGHKYSPDAYAALVTAADANRTLNFGALTAAERLGQKSVMVRDGNGCGITSHNDPDKANGLILDIDEARAHPIAHPYCTRTFSPQPPGRGRKVAKKLAKAVAGVVVAGAVAEVAGVATLRLSESARRSFTDFVTRANPEFLKYQHRVLQEAATLRKTAEEVQAGVDSEMNEWVETGVAAKERTRRLLGMNVASPMRVVGDEYNNILDFSRMETIAQQDIDLQNSVGGHVLSLVTGGEGGNVAWSLPKILGSNRNAGMSYISQAGRISGKIGSELTGSYSRKIGDIFRFGAYRRSAKSGTAKYMTVSPGRLFRYRFSKIKYGFANHFVVNPNGILRAGFDIDPRTGFIIPNLRYLPKGPLRVYMTPNRSVGSKVTGSILSRRIGELMSPKAVHTVVNELGQERKSVLAVTSRDIIRKGTPGKAGFLRVDDFNQGAIKDLLYVAKESDIAQEFSGTDMSGIIRRGRIPDGMTVAVKEVVRNAETGKLETKTVRKHVDLLIKNGKFVRKFEEGGGKIVSVSTTVRLIVTKNIRFNLRTNLNLRALGLEAFKDIRHLSLREIQKVNLRNDFRIRSLSLEMKFFGYKPWEISKVLRLPMDDAMRLYRDARLYLEQGAKKAFLNFLTNTAFFLDFSQQEILRAINGSSIARARAGEYFRQWKQKIIDDPMDFVLGVEKDEKGVRKAKRRKSFEVAYDRPKVHKMLFRDDELSRQIDELSKIIGMTQEEIMELLDVDEVTAQSLWHNANAALNFITESFPDAGQIGVPDHLELYWDEISKTDILSLAKVKDIAIGEFGPTFHAGAENMRQDLAATASALQDYFPGAGELRILPSTIELDQFTGGATAFHIPQRDLKTIGALLRQQHLDDMANIVESSSTDTIFLSRKVINQWLKNPLGDPEMIRDVHDGWFIPGSNHLISTVVHEFGHHLHESLLPEEVVDLLESTAELLNFKMLQFTGNKIAREDMINMNDVWNLRKEMKTLGHNQKNLEKRIDQLFDSWNKKDLFRTIVGTILKDELSGYGATSFWELIAESIGEYVMTPNPRMLSKLVGDFMREKLG